MRTYLDTVMGEIAKVLYRVSEETTRQLLETLKTAKRVYIAGVGRSGLVVKAFGQRLMHLGYDVHLADEITAPAIQAKDLLICCSGTGQTQLLLYMARKAHKIGAKIIAITADGGSELARLSSLVVEIPAPLEFGKERDGLCSVQPARSLFEQAMLVYLDMVVLWLMNELKISEKKIEKRHANLE